MVRPVAIRILLFSVESTSGQRHKINELEKVQRRTARWTMSDYNWSSTVTSMLETLHWPNVTEHRRLHMFYKSIYHLTALQLPTYFLRTQRSTRQNHWHPLHFINYPLY